MFKQLLLEENVALKIRVCLRLLKNGDGLTVKGRYLEEVNSLRYLGAVESRIVLAGSQILCAM